MEKYKERVRPFIPMLLIGEAVAMTLGFIFAWGNGLSNDAMLAQALFAGGFYAVFYACWTLAVITYRLRKEGK